MTSPSQGGCGPALHDDPQDRCNGELQKHDGPADEEATDGVIACFTAELPFLLEILLPLTPSIFHLISLRLKEFSVNRLKPLTIPGLNRNDR